MIHIVHQSFSTILHVSKHSDVFSYQIKGVHEGPGSVKVATTLLLLLFIDL